MSLHTVDATRYFICDTDTVKNIRDGQYNVLTMCYFKIFWGRAKIQHLPRLKTKKKARTEEDEEEKLRNALTHSELRATIHTHMHTLLKSLYTNPDNARGSERRCEHSSGIA